MDGSSSDGYADYIGRLYNKEFYVPEDPVPTIELEEGHQISVNISLDNGEELSWADVRLYFWSPRGLKLWSKPGHISGNGQTLTLDNLPEWNTCSFEAGRQPGRYVAYSGKELNKTFSIPGNAPDVVLSAGHSGSARVTLNGVPQKNVVVSLEGDNFLTAWTMMRESQNSLPFQVSRTFILR